MLKWDSPRDKENYKMMCSYCHQTGSRGWRTPEKPVDWETMITRMDGFGGLYKHTQKTLVKSLVETYSDEAVANWPPFVPPSAPKGAATQARITEWDMGDQFKVMVHDIEPGRDGLMYAVDMARNAVVTLDPETGKRKVHRLPGRYRGPHSIEPDNDGHMWITCCASGEMAKFDVNTKIFTIASSAEAPAKRGSYPHTLRVNPKDPEGLIWYTDAGSELLFLHSPENNEGEGIPPPEQRPGGWRWKRRVARDHALRDRLFPGRRNDLVFQTQRKPHRPDRPENTGRQY